MTLAISETVAVAISETFNAATGLLKQLLLATSETPAIGSQKHCEDALRVPASCAWQTACLTRVLLLDLLPAALSVCKSFRRPM